MPHEVQCPYLVVAKISDFTSNIMTINRFFANSAKEMLLSNIIIMRLLQAVAYGMESKEANEPVKASDVGNLFKSHLFAKNLLLKSPEYLLKRGDVTDWAGRTFKNITAFEYALWAKDFKMMQMMLECIPATPEGDEIRKALIEQYEQVTKPIYAGGGLTYMHTYDRPNLSTEGIPDGTTTRVKEMHTENHFNLTPLYDVYQRYNNISSYGLNRHNYWLILIGKLQRLLPIHLLQRYCDPKTPFDPLPEFSGEFRRSTNFYHWVRGVDQSLFGTNPLFSSDFSLIRSNSHRPQVGLVICPGDNEYVIRVDSNALLQLDRVSTNEIEKIGRILGSFHFCVGNESVI